MSKEMLRLEKIVKQFPGVLALNNVDLEIKEGDVLALVGENGAGKSTLIKIISGAYQQDSGNIYFEGQLMEKLTPKKAIDSGIAVIYQELSYMPYMTVAENIFLGNLPMKGKIVDYDTLKNNSKKIQEEIGLGHLDPFTKVLNLSTAEKQLLEIARAYARDAKVLILDEPTSALNENETAILFKEIKKLQADGRAIIYISHKMDEIFEICNKIQIMRDGTKVFYGNLDELSRNEIISYMVGREINDMYPVGKRQFGENILKIENIENEIIKSLSIHVKAKEIVGLYGLMGSGCAELLEMIFGYRESKYSSFEINGKKVSIANPRQAIKEGLAYTPGERKTEGLMLNQSVLMNALSVTLGNYKKNGILNWRKMREGTQNWVNALGIKTPSVNTMVSSLSGGNQQKVILARWLDNKPKVFLLNEPTKGVDVGAKVEIYKQMEKICQNGSGIIVVTSDLPELLGICDRVYVMHEGSLIKELQKEEMTQENVVRYAIGEQ